ncbi:MAG: response regulator transcription factor [Chloroflexi bacterium]|nr:response regulator transcription factor [Chloroflexota bacterium]MCI0782337.1 response regulator transcription factor [Chloroflexota bacterium]MCI0787526.1 response regulator transcription factor [Chloroflexota bacterium]MCI0826039.1 response regulator transcription factor [Chloroflexota bacterium]MCI0859536.1 response regulator transcription factor [Chloroflexota bacterium]
MSTIRVLVVDDHDMFRRGVMEVLEREDDITVIGEARNGQQAIDRASELSPDVVFMDLNMPGKNGIEATACLTLKWPDLKVLVLTVSEEAGDLYRALSVGARGYVLKISDAQEIIDALRQVHQGWVVVSPAMAPRLLSDLGQSPDIGAASQTLGGLPAGETQLTPREMEILRLMARGMSNAELADTLLVSETTLKIHVKNILGKLHMKNRREAAAYAARLGFIQPGDSEMPRSEV